MLAVKLKKNFLVEFCIWAIKYLPNTQLIYALFFNGHFFVLIIIYFYYSSQGLLEKLLTLIHTLAW